MEVPTITSGTIPCASRVRMTPICANPRAAPPPSASPMVGRTMAGCGCVEASAARSPLRARANKPSKTTRGFSYTPRLKGHAHAGQSSRIILLAESCDGNVTGILRPPHYVMVKCRITAICSSTAEVRHDSVQLWSVAIFGRLCRTSHVDKAGNALMRSKTESIKDAPVIGVPFGDPASGIAHGVRGEDQAHCRGAGRELLLPFGNLHMRAGAADDGDNERCAC